MPVLKARASNLLISFVIVSFLMMSPYNTDKPEEEKPLHELNSSDTLVDTTQEILEKAIYKAIDKAIREAIEEALCEVSKEIKRYISHEVELVTLTGAGFEAFTTGKVTLHKEYGKNALVQFMLKQNEFYRSKYSKWDVIVPCSTFIFKYPMKQFPEGFSEEGFWHIDVQVDDKIKNTDINKSVGYVARIKDAKSQNVSAYLEITLQINGTSAPSKAKEEVLIRRLRATFCFDSEKGWEMEDIRFEDLF